MGYASSTRYYRIDVIPYSNNPALEIPLKKTYYAIEDDVKEGSLIVDTGLAARIFNRYLIELSISKGVIVAGGNQICT